MLFNSYIFVFVFLPITLCVWWLPLPTRVRLIALALASYVFYSYWDWRYTFLMLVTSGLDYVAGHFIYRATTVRAKRLFLLGSIIPNLGLLAFFKYYNFFADSINAVSAGVHADPIAPILGVVLPIGISFYTFESMSYSIDIYRKKTKPAQSFWHFAAYVCWFPHLVAGPIIRYTDIDAQLETIPTRLSALHAQLGVQFFVLGLVKKIWLADVIAARSDPLLLNWQHLGLLQAWQAALGYTLQLYFDFSAYSDMAVGLGYLIGFKFIQNFNSPYKSANISEFWRRWHISLSSWLRDYLYIPLGGNRGTRAQAVRNLMITMFLGGLWHGAAWTFAFWGAYHGVLLAVHHVWRSRSPVPLARVVGVLGTFVVVVVGWVFFRAASFAMAGHLLASMVGLHGIGPLHKSLAVLIPAGLALCFFAPNTWQLPRLRGPSWGIALGCAFAACILAFADKSPFLYFQF